MSMALIESTIAARATVLQSRILDASKRRFDDALVRYDAWYLIFVAVILALGATIYAGLLIWCVVYKDRRFTGSWSFRNFGLQVSAQCV